MKVSANIRNLNTNLNSKKQVAFNGFIGSPAMMRTLDAIGRAGSKPSTPTLVSSAGILAARPLITMSDKDTPLNDRINSAVWISAISLAGLAIQLSYDNKFTKFAENAAQKILGISLKDSKHLLKNPALLKAVVEDPKTATKIANMTDDQLKSFTQVIDKEITAARTEARSLKKLIPSNWFKKRRKTRSKKHTSQKPRINRNCL